ncbi:MAG: alpha-amylase, partial [Lachnospiraceae bacterium]|nr:alpha-amylase [Lachnospiraceae bacterium]
PGTFKAVAAKVQYIRSLGFNAVLLMPCYDFDEVMPAGFGQPARINYWGYGSPANYFAPKTAYAADPKKVCEEFASMVKAFHAAGIEVLMEMDFTPQVPDILTLEVLRFWHETYHIDGFRLMSGSFSPRLAATDPYLRGVKLIRDYWSEDCTGTMQLRERPVLAESNDDYMEAVRRFLIGDEGVVKEFSERIRDNGNLAAKVNYFADHNGFTLADVFSYDVRHNEANNEKNLDGREINHSWNCGVEGPAAGRTVNRLRLKMIKNALAVLFMSQGAPMLMAGDECGSTHFGNNNPYCCDNAQGWVVWQNNAFANEIRRFTKDMIALRRAHRIFSNIIELRGSDYIHSGCPDVSFHGTKAWYPDFGYFSRTLGMLLNGEYAITDRVNRDTSFYVAFNMHWEEHEFDLPSVNHSTFRFVFATDAKTVFDGGKTCCVAPRSIAVFAVEKGKGKG